jgi:hypothetical protein
MCIKLVIKTNLYYDARSEKHQIMIGLCNVHEVENQCLHHLYAVCASDVSMYFVKTKG